MPKKNKEASVPAAVTKKPASKKAAAKKVVAKKVAAKKVATKKAVAKKVAAKKASPVPKAAVKPVPTPVATKTIPSTTAKTVVQAREPKAKPVPVTVPPPAKKTTADFLREALAAKMASVHGDTTRLRPDMGNAKASKDAERRFGKSRKVH